MVKFKKSLPSQKENRESHGKVYAVTKDSKKGKYLVTFTLWNLLFIVILLGVTFIM